MSRLVMITFNSFSTLFCLKKSLIDAKTLKGLLGMLQDFMIMAAIVMFAMALTLLIGR